jgi:hypothetical protein
MLFCLDLKVEPVLHMSHTYVCISAAQLHFNLITASVRNNKLQYHIALCRCVSLVLVAL